ncbi:hypothetical protein HDU97_009680 [Phlyctochytrium planicorne]|nr:hypothetical protein HDU97_009680 [Phlyctochytrium planicorne]
MSSSGTSIGNDGRPSTPSATTSPTHPLQQQQQHPLEDVVDASTVTDVVDPKVGIVVTAATDSDQKSDETLERRLSQQSSVTSSSTNTSHNGPRDPSSLILSGRSSTLRRTPSFTNSESSNGGSSGAVSRRNSILDRQQQQQPKHIPTTSSLASSEQGDDSTTLGRNVAPTDSGFLQAKDASAQAKASTPKRWNSMSTTASSKTAISKRQEDIHSLLESMTATGKQKPTKATAADLKNMPFDESSESSVLTISTLEAELDPTNAKTKTRKCRRPSPCAIACICISAFFLASSAILTPLMFKFIIPKLISEGFSSGTGMTDALFTVTKLSIINVEEAQTGGPDPLPITTSMVDAKDGDVSLFATAGGAKFDVAMWNEGYSVPLGLPVSVAGPSVWTISMGRGYVSDSGKSAVYPYVPTQSASSWGQSVDSAPEDSGFYPVAVVNLPSPIDIESGKLSLDQAGGVVRVPAAPPALSSAATDSTTASLVPMAVALVKGICKGFMSGSPADTPKVLIRSTADFKVGPFSFRSIPLSRVFDLGKIFGSNGLTLKGLKNQPDSGAGSGVGLKVDSLNSTNANDDLVARVTLSLKSASPFTLSIRNFSLRLNISNTPIAIISIPDLTTRSDSSSIKFDMAFKPIKASNTTRPTNSTSSSNSTNFITSTTPSTIMTVSNLLFMPQSNWVIGIDSLKLEIGNPYDSTSQGRSIAWANELAKAISLEFPFSIINGDAGLQAGVWIVKVLQSLVKDGDGW